VIRQVAEPRILGESMGVPPLLTLCALFVGYRLLGFAGFLFAPLVVLIVFGRVSE
jgi:predicted PurR-regulated permease PerM